VKPMHAEPTWESTNAVARTFRHAEWRIASLLLVPLLCSAGCLYMPPPPTSVWPVEDGEVSISLHLTADLLFLERGESLLSSMGFFPCVRYGLSCEQEALLFPWPAYRHWCGLEEGRRLCYHQISLGKFLPVESFVRRAGSESGTDGRDGTGRSGHGSGMQSGSFLGGLGTEYVRYDFRAFSGESAPVCWMTGRSRSWTGSSDSNDDLSAATRNFLGFFLELRGRAVRGGALEVHLGSGVGRASRDLGFSLEPGLIAIPFAKAPAWGEHPARAPSRWWLREVRLALWGGS